MFGLKGVAVSPDQIAVSLQPRQLPRPRPGGKDNVFRRKIIDALGRFDRDHSRRRDRRIAHEHGHFVFLHQMANAARKLFGHAP